MNVQQKNIFGSPFVGVYGSSSQDKTLLPKNVPEKFEETVSKYLGTTIIKTSIYDSTLLGIFSAFNQNGIILPRVAYQEEIDFLEKKFPKVGVVQGFTAVGNMVACNDEGCLASPLFNKKDVETMENTLGVKVSQYSLAGINVVGSCVVATNKGFLANPNVNQKELEKLEKTFKTEGNVGSLNYGNPFIGGCIIVNQNGAIVGDTTSPFEVGRVDEALFLGRD
jgi:translation initiation factor 6